LPYEVRCYDSRYAASWLACWLEAAGASHAAWHVYQTKPTYDGPAVELVALDAGGEVVGLLDIELEQEPGSLCLRAGPGLGFV